MIAVLRAWLRRPVPLPDPGELVAAARYNVPDGPRKCGRPVRLVTVYSDGSPRFAPCESIERPCTNVHALPGEMPVEERVRWSA